jgi:8-oxo-dGTP pyrophosphatase MutT (NUDIX family)
LTVLHHAVASCNDRVSDDDCADPSTVTQARQGDASAAPAFALGGVDEREERTKIAEDCPIVMVGFDSLWERIFHDQSREDKNRKFALRQLVGLAAFQWPFWQQTIVRAAQTTYWLRPALEFPKGHKASLSETDAECAAREVCEETQLRLHEDYELNQAIYPIHETFVGMNRKTYKYTYNVGTVLLESRFHPSHLLKQVADAAGLDGVPKSPQAQLEADADSGEQPRVLELDLLADKTKSGKGVGESAFEIGSVAWYSAHALVDEIRPTHVTRRDVARKVQKLLLKHHV